MGILDYLRPGDRDDLLELLRNSADTSSVRSPDVSPASLVQWSQQDLPSPLDTALWPAGPVGAPATTDASRRSPAPFSFASADRMLAPNQPSPLDSARWPIGPVGAPSHYVEEQDEASPLDRAPWPVGPVGAPPHTDASMFSPAPFGFVPAPLSGGFSRGLPARSVMGARPLSSVSPGLGAEIDRAPAHDAAAGPVGAPSRRNPSLLSPLPFGSVPAQLSGGVLDSPPAATQAPPQAGAARGDGSGQQHAADGNVLLAAADGWLNGVPVVGPYLISLGDRNMAKARAERYGTRYDDELAFLRGLSKQARDDHPYVSIGSGLVAGMTSLAPFGLTATGARLLGLAEGPILAMMARGATTGAAIGGADAAARGARGGDIAVGAGLGAAGGLLGARVFQGLARRWPESAARFIGGGPPRIGWFLERHSASQQTE